MTDSDSATDDSPGSLAEAQAAVSRAQARAEEARARAVDLRKQADAGSDDQSEPAASRWKRPQLRRLRRPTWTEVGVAAGIALVCVSLAASGVIVAQHLSLEREHRRAAEFTGAARRAVVQMLSIDPAHVKDDVQSSIDHAASPLKEQLAATSAYMVKNAQEAKVTTKASVADVAVDSITDDSAAILMVVKSDTTNADNTKRPPAWWRLSVDVKRDQGQLKISKIDFLQ